MPRKLPAKAAPVIPAEIIEQAKRSVTTDRAKRAERCEVCGSETAVGPQDKLCWVCRRLKISAWHDSEQQMPAQE